MVGHSQKKVLLVRCPKWLFKKFNILEFERGAEQGNQRQLWEIRLRTKTCQNCPKFAGPIYFHAHVYVRKSFRTKTCQNCPKFAGPIYFHVHVYRKEFLQQFLLISLLRSQGSLRLPRSLRARIIEFFELFLPFRINRIINFRIKSNEFRTNSNLTPPLSWHLSLHRILW